jgi:hypothetical protein
MPIFFKNLYAPITAAETIISIEEMLMANAKVKAWLVSIIYLLSTLVFRESLPELLQEACQ